MSTNKEQKKNQYQLQEQKIIQINKLATEDPRQRAVIMRDISIAFFGFIRYKQVILQCSLNKFRTALSIASIMHRRMQKLAMIIKFKETRYWVCENGTDKKDEKNISLFWIKLTLQPTQQDKKQPGFHQGLTNIQRPLRNIMRIYQDKQQPKPNKNNKNNYNKASNDSNENQKKQTKNNYRQERNEEPKNRNQSKGKGQSKNKGEPTMKSEPKAKIQSTNRGQQNKKGVQPKTQGQSNNKSKNIKDEPKAKNQSAKGQSKAEGQSKNKSNVAQHHYNPGHLNRDVEQKKTEDRGDRRPRRQNRYQD